MNELIEFCNKISILDEISSADLNSILKTKSVKKNEYLADSNSHSKELFFIKKGIVKLCFNGNGKEFIMRFFEENILFADIESYVHKKHSKYEIVAIEDTEYYSFSFLEFEQLCLKHHRLETFFRKFMTIANLNMMKRISEILEEDATKRYSNFRAQNPKLLERISLGDLANYLGITQVSLSRIRAIK
ncbi:Crp/Fnr family transcriptional regulator [Flavobacterium sp. 316]|uniref:Crp/Fnr family transcriptional regulator n=1 Tax=Flavobacterium sp. 316 TaxID=1603293 RepID=UPI000697C4AE|nr:Crp/Fnr family transcriptional regulator [Flavobacterium sp. 316]